VNMVRWRCAPLPRRAARNLLRREASTRHAQTNARGCALMRVRGAKQVLLEPVPCSPESSPTARGPSRRQFDIQTIYRLKTREEAPESLMSDSATIGSCGRRWPQRRTDGAVRMQNVIRPACYQRYARSQSAFAFGGTAPLFERTQGAR